MNRADLCGVDIDDMTKDAVIRLAKMKTEYQALLKACQKKIESKNNLSGITGEAFQDGKVVGNLEGMKNLLNFLLDIYAYSCNNATEE
jgi:hypothetical protein